MTQQSASWNDFSCLAAVAAVALAGMPTAGLAQVVRADPITRVRPDSKANRLLNSLEQEYAQNSFQGAWAWKIRETIELGPEAVPELIVELDATDSDMMLRNLGFILRAIGDKRAVPALIRAFPKTLRKPGSDMGLRANDPGLLAFMQKHDLNEQDRGDSYSFGRPVREIGGALEKLTGQKHGEEELYSVFQRGGELQNHLQRKLFRACAERWAAWWESHWKEHVSDQKYARVRLPEAEESPVKLFPSGPGVKFSGGSRGHTAEADTDPAARREVFFDLDTGRMRALPEALQALQDDPHRLDKIQDWAAREGYDLMGTMYQPPGEQQPHFAIRGLGLTAWEIDADRYDKLESEVKAEKPLTMGRPAAGLLLHYDSERGACDSTAVAAFLFVTRESTYGALFVGVEVLDTNVKIGQPSQGDPALNPVGFVKGRRFNYKVLEQGEE